LTQVHPTPEHLVAQALTRLDELDGKSTIKDTSNSSPPRSSPSKTADCQPTTTYLVTHEGLARLDQLDGVCVQLCKVLACVGDLPGRPAHPGHNLLDVVNVLLQK
jgi:hypothetical protein